jgi:hypothetical protein
MATANAPEIVTAETHAKRRLRRARFARPSCDIGIFFTIPATHCPQPQRDLKRALCTPRWKWWTRLDCRMPLKNAAISMLGSKGAGPVVVVDRSSSSKRRAVDSCQTPM